MKRDAVRRGHRLHVVQRHRVEQEIAPEAHAVALVAQAHLHVRNQRWFICPNPGFKKQLLAFEKELKSIESQPKEIPVKFLNHQL